MAEKVILAYPWGPEEETRAETVFYLAATARDMGLDISIFFFVDGVLLTKKGVVEMVSKKVADGMQDALRTGIKVYACEASARSKGLVKEDLIGGVEIIGYVTFLDMTLEAKTVITI